MKRLALTIVVLAVLMLPTADASAASGLPAVQKACSAAIKNRDAVLDELTKSLNTSTHVRADHKSGLLTEISIAQSGLNALNGTIQTDTTAAAAATDCKKIVTGYRVYAVVVPKVYEIVAADSLAEVATAEHATIAPLSLQLEAAARTGQDVTAAQTTLNDLRTQSDKVTQGTDALYGPLLSLQAADYPANQSVIKSSRQTLGTLVTDAKAGRTDIQTFENESRLAPVS